MSAKKENLFWADKLADRIISRKKFEFIDRAVPEIKEYTVKTSASISGVLHIGRLSDTIRGASVHKALEDAGAKARLIWVAEDMDPLRKIPEGVPKKYEEYIGVSVTEIPDPWGCHKTYAEHHTSRYFRVLDSFVSAKMQKFSMSEEYKKGNFKPFIKKLLEKVEIVKEIQNRYRTNPLPERWSPWTPICKNCGKIITPCVTDFDGKTVKYACKDYSFEKTTAKGCGYKGEADPLKDEGKLMWKSEWAAQWARWKVSSEGAGKEYESRNSAFWINAEIAEKILDFPKPEPIFYEHLMIDGTKMSASLGNVVYPSDWLEVASPQILKFFYNKKLMKTRSFSWKDLPRLYDDYDAHAIVYFGRKEGINEKETEHMKRLYGISQLGEIENPIKMSYSYAANLVQLVKDEKTMMENLKKTGHYSKETEKSLAERLALAKKWVEKYAPKECRIILNEKIPDETKKKLSEEQKKAIKLLASRLKMKKYKEDELFSLFRELSSELDMSPIDFFRGVYLALLNKEKGPKLASFILMVGQEKVADVLDTILS